MLAPVFLKDSPFSSHSFPPHYSPVLDIPSQTQTWGLWNKGHLPITSLLCGPIVIPLLISFPLHAELRDEGWGRGAWEAARCVSSPPPSLLCSGSVTGKPEEGELELPT